MQNRGKIKIYANAEKKWPLESSELPISGMSNGELNVGGFKRKSFISMPILFKTLDLKSIMD